MGNQQLKELTAKTDGRKQNKKYRMDKYQCRDYSLLCKIKRQRQKSIEESEGAQDKGPANRPDFHITHRKYV